MSDATSPVLVIHGGAGVIGRDLDAGKDQQARTALMKALQDGYAQLKAGRSALDAVTAAIIVLEDDACFNAGKGAVFNQQGRQELAAAVMDGECLRAGAVAGLQCVKNPVMLARAVLEHTSHLMLIGAGAEAFAKKQGLVLVGPAYFHTEERWRQLQHALMQQPAHFGTVGAVALDHRGHLAAGTSTGGMTAQACGRVGDTPIIGAGTYANAHCAVSGTGWGEFYIRVAAAHQICMRVSLLGETVHAAAAEVIDRQIPALGGHGGAIVLDAQGSIAMPFNTDGMYRGWIGADGAPHVAIHADEAGPVGV